MNHQIPNSGIFDRIHRIHIIETESYPKFLLSCIQNLVSCIMNESWYFLDHGPHAPAWNMACDEWLLHHAKLLNRPILRTYAWDRPSITIGYFQPYPKEVSKHTVIRRPTGGAQVFHDSDLTFTVVLPPEHEWYPMRAYDRYQAVHQRISKVFKRRGFSPAFAEDGSQEKKMVGSRERYQGNSLCFVKHSRYDVIVDGIKVAGGAQRVTREGLLHQGSIQGCEKRVSSQELKCAWESFGTIFADLKLKVEDENAIEALAVRKYGTDEWNSKRTS